MNIELRRAAAEVLKQRGIIFVSNGYNKPRDIVTLRDNLIYVESKFSIVHPFEGYALDNPMTWDTFIHLYLLNK